LKYKTKIVCESQNSLRDQNRLQESKQITRVKRKIAILAFFHLIKQKKYAETAFFHKVIWKIAVSAFLHNKMKKMLKQYFPI
jgi:hypothetical protein